MKNKKTNIEAPKSSLGWYGFTLIELLVVVLIIGILASVAIPQYKKLIVKSHLSNMQQIMASFKKAEEIYFMLNGSYTDKVSLLDIDLSACPARAEGSDILVCSSLFMLDPIEGSLSKNSTSYNIRALYCPKDAEQSNSSMQCYRNADFVYIVWLNHSNKPNQIECIGSTPLGHQICNSL